MKAPRGLSEDEAAAWARLAATVEPIRALPPESRDNAFHDGAADKASFARAIVGSTRPLATPANKPAPSRPTAATRPSNPADTRGLDSHWERRLRAGTLAPDFTLDLHEHSLDAAYQRLLGGLDIARETGARVVLVIAGRERPTHAADRADKRGAIRAKLLDWLAASRHASAIAAIRKAHRRHGGEGALYVILKKPR